MVDAKKSLPEIIRKEVDGSHYYWVNGDFFPSVTAILDEAAPTSYGLRQFLLNNTPDSAQEIKEDTADFGSKLHTAYQRLLNGEELDLINICEVLDLPITKQTKAKKYLMSFHNWFHTFSIDLKSIQTEHTVASMKRKIAGTLDFSCLDKDGKRWIIDFKNTSGIYFSHELQVSAYKEFYEEMYDTKVDNMAILRLGTRHKAGYEFKIIDRPVTDFDNVFGIYLSLHGGKIPDPPMVDVYPDKLRLWEPVPTGESEEHEKE